MKLLNSQKFREFQFEISTHPVESSKLTGLSLKFSLNWTPLRPRVAKIVEIGSKSSNFTGIRNDFSHTFNGMTYKAEPSYLNFLWINQKEKFLNMPAFWRALLWYFSYFILWQFKIKCCHYWDYNFQGTLSHSWNQRPSC